MDLCTLLSSTTLRMKWLISECHWTQKNVCETVLSLSAGMSWSKDETRANHCYRICTSSSERGLCNWCKVPSSADVPSGSHMLREKSSMHLKNSSSSHSEHCWTVTQRIWKDKVIQCIWKNCPPRSLQSKELKELPYSYTSNTSCPRALKIQFQFFIFYSFCSCIRSWFSQ